MTNDTFQTVEQILRELGTLATLSAWLFWKQTWRSVADDEQRSLNSGMLRGITSTSPSDTSTTGCLRCRSRRGQQV